MSKYSRRARKAERDRLREEWEATQEQKENEAIDIEDVKQQDDMEKGKYLKMSILGDLNINPKKHREKQRQKKIEDLSKRPGTSAEGEAAKRKLKRPEDLPNFLQSAEMDKIYAEDAKKNKEFDEAVARGDLKEGVKIRQAEIKDYQDPTLLQLISTWSNPQWRKDNIGSHLSGGGDAIYNDPLSLYSDALTTLDKAAGIHDKRRALIDYISDKNEIAGIAAEFIPGAESLAGAGAGIKAIKKASMVYDLDAPRILSNGYERLRGIGRTIKSLAGGDSIVGNIGTGLDKAIKKTTNTLDPKGLRDWGSDRRISGAKFITGNKIQDKDTFMQAGWRVLANLNKNFGIDINRAISPIQIHHKGVIRQIAESANGLTDEGAKLAGDYISKRVGFKMGYDGTNAAPLPPKFHQRVHDIINDSISGRWGDNLEGLVQKLGLPKNWQTTMDLQARIDAGIYDEIAAAINESTKAIDTFWKSVSTRTNLGKLSPKEYREATFEVLEVDEMLKNLRRTRSLSPETGYTITQAVNELLEKAGRIDLQSPIFDKLTPEMTKEAYKFALQNNGWKALQEVITTGQDSATVFKAYGIKTKGFEEVLTQLGIPGLSKSKELGTGSFLGRPKGSKTSKSKLQKQQKKKYDEDPDIKQKPTQRDETKPMDPPPEKD